MIHYYMARATKAIVEYLINGNKEFYTSKTSFDGELRVNFLATPEYVEKMKARPFLQDTVIIRKA